jgi:hypothetical protein
MPDVSYQGWKVHLVRVEKGLETEIFDLPTIELDHNYPSPPVVSKGSHQVHFWILVPSCSGQ